MKVVVDFDDLCDIVADDSLRYLEQLKEEFPALKVTLFTIPCRTSDKVIKMYKQYDWVALAPHGWRHTRGECLTWTSEEATSKILAAKDRGIDAPIFRAPGWLIDEETYTACAELGIVVADHKEHNVDGIAKVYRYNSHTGKAKRVTSAHGHLTPVSGNYIKELLDSGTLQFMLRYSQFCWPWEVAV